MVKSYLVGGLELFLQRSHYSPSLESLVDTGNHPQMAELFSLVKYLIFSQIY